MRWLGAVALVAVLSTGPSLAQPAPAVDAAVHVDRGVTLFKKNTLASLKGALAEFEAAHRIGGSWKVLAHIGATQARLGRYQDAIRTIERYLAEGGEQIPEATRAMLRREIEGFRALLSDVTIIVGGGDAEVEIDGQIVGRAPLPGPVRLGPGDHTIVARRPGFAPASEKVKLDSGSRRTVRLDLVRLPGHLRVDTRPSGAEVLLDGRAVGHAPWDDERVAPGSHEVQVRLRGYLGRRETVDILAGRTKALSYDLVIEPPPPPKPWHRRWYVWTVIGGVVVAGVVTAAVVATWPRYDVVIKPRAEAILR